MLSKVFLMSNRLVTFAEGVTNAEKLFLMSNWLSFMQEQQLF